MTMEEWKENISLEASNSKIISKILLIFIKYIWACRKGKILPTGKSCISYIINKIRFFSASPPIFVRDGKIQELTLLFKGAVSRDF